MADTTDLLNELRIDRQEPATRKPRARWIAIALVAAALLVAGFWLYAPAARPEVTTVAALATSYAKSGGSSVLDASGYVTARRQATVSSKITGKVVEVLIEEGMAVKQGQLLARLDASNAAAQLALAQSQLESARSAIAETRVQLKEAERNLKRTTELQQRKLASQSDLDRDRSAADVLTARIGSLNSAIRVAAAQLAVQDQQVEDTEIRAPFDGVVVTKDAQPGEIISPISAGGGFTRTGICTIVDMESLEVEVDVNEAYINRVQAGQRVTTTLNAYPDWQIPAEVIAIIPTADRSRATVRVRIRLLNTDTRVLPDMGVKVSFLEATDESQAAETPAKGVLVPTSALQRDNKKAYVYVVKNELVERRAVQTAKADNVNLRITAGLQPGERVVAPLTPELLDKLADGVRVKVTG